MSIQSVFDDQIYQSINEFNAYEPFKFAEYVEKEYILKGKPFDSALKQLIDKLNKAYRKEFKFMNKFIKFNKSTGMLTVQRYEREKNAES